MKAILYQFIQVKLTLACQVMLVMSLFLDELKKVGIHSNSNATSKHATEVLIIIFDYLTCKQNDGKSKWTKFHEILIELKG